MSRIRLVSLTKLGVPSLVTVLFQLGLTEHHDYVDFRN